MYDENGVPVGAYGNEKPRRWFGKLAQVIIVVALVVAVLRLLIPAEKDDVDTPVEAVNVSSSSAIEQYTLGETYFEAEDFASAVYAYTQAINLGYSPIDRAYFERGRAEYRLKNYEAAIESYTRSLELGTDCDECYVDYHNRGHAYWQLEKYDDAIADFDQAIVIKPDYLAAYVSRTKLLEQRDTQSPTLASLNTGFNKAAGEVKTRTIIPDQQRDLAIKTGGEQYQFMFAAVEGEEVRFSIPSASVDVVLLIRNPRGAAVAFDDSGDDVGGDELTYRIEAAGDYTITVASYSPDALGEFSLLMTVMAAEDLPMTFDMLEHLTLADVIDTQPSTHQALSEDGSTLAEYAPKELFLYDLTETRAERRSFEIPYSDVTAIALSADGYKLAVSAPDRLMIYSTASLTVLTTIVTDDLYPSAMVFSKDGSLLAVAFSNLVVFYDTDSGDRTASLYLNGYHGHSLDISDDNKWLVVGQDQGRVQVWNLERRTPIRAVETQKIEDITAVAFSPDASLIAAGGEARRVSLWAVSSGDLLHTYTDHSRTITDVVFSLDGQVLVSSSQDETVILREIDDPESAVPLRHQDKVTQVVFQAGGSTLITTSEDLKVQFWRVKE